ncbi:serotriflin-like [Haliotis cracherodii]|uniref:serotriflin-like n=1 Tax=Haliotis cracherodii TaxID=6455 RepID=UPI0039EB8F66
MFLLARRALCVILALSGVLCSSAPSDTNTENRRGHRHGRSANCHEKYQQSSDHSACLVKSSQALVSGVSAADQVGILNLHNTFRNNVNPAATNMLKLSWDNTVAMIAQRFADSCRGGHDTMEQRSIPGYLRVGQNIALHSASWAQAFAEWSSEEQNFTFGANNDLGTIGHYSQLVWADTQTVGCGYADCGNATYYVCNYGPPGNIGDFNTPYKSGISSECSAQHLDGKQCDCGVVCLNGGQVFRENCTCKCQAYPFYTGNNCQLECSNVETDPSECSGTFAGFPCTVVAVNCPNRCGVCPYGGIHYTGSPSGSTTDSPDGGASGSNNKQIRASGDVILAACMVIVTRMGLFHL